MPQAMHAKRQNTAGLRPVLGLGLRSRAAVARPPNGRSWRTEPSTRAQLRTEAAPAVHQLRQDNPAFRAALAAQDAVLGHVASQLELLPAHCPGADGEGTLSFSSQEPGSLGAAVTALHGGRVRWLSVSAVASAAQDFGTSRLMGWVNPSTDAPHYALEFGVFGRGPEARAQGTLTLCHRSDIVLDLDYVERYYDRVPRGHADQPHPHRSWNDVCNACAAQQARTWRHYQVPQADMKPVLANSVSYSFPAEEGEVAAFGEAALEAAALWAGFLLELELTEPELSSPGRSAARREIVAGYDARYAQVVRTDPGNRIGERVLGAEAILRLVEMTVGPGAL